MRHESDLGNLNFDEARVWTEGFFVFQKKNN